MLRKISLLLCSIVLIHSLAGGQSTGQSGDQSSDKKLFVPAGTVLQLTLNDPLSSKLSAVGDEVEATLAKDLVVEGSRLLLRGTEFIGRVTLIQPARRTLKGGQLQVTFDRVMIDGQERKLYSLLNSASDFQRDQKFESDSEGTLKAGKNGGGALSNAEIASTIGYAGATIAILATIHHGDISSTGGAIGAALLGSSMATG